ncbi:MAG: hypothetical protein JOZ54_04405, partial [Acidobacteria bacterium]|nr:hypothetical protein [Acidobacteriota bacterium]
DWLHAEERDSWSFLPAAAETLARQNGDGRRLVELSGSDDPFDAATVVVGGYLGEGRDSRLALISATGGVVPFDRGQPLVVGAPQVETAMLAAWKATVAIAPNEDPGKQMFAALRATIDTVPLLGGEIQHRLVLRTPPSGAE